jgi:hypothetical protein
MSNLCNILCPIVELIDKNGCIKKEAHNDSHIFVSPDGSHIEWEDDYSCKCGCWDDESDLKNVCKIYKKL